MDGFTNSDLFYFFKSANVGSPSTAPANPVNHQIKSENSNFSTNVVLSCVINGLRITRVSSAAPSFAASPLVWRLRPRPLLRGGSKVGSGMAGVTTWCLPHRPPDGGRQSATVPTVTCKNGEGSQTSTYACLKMSLKKPSALLFFLWNALAIWNSWHMLFAFCRRKNSPPVFLHTRRPVIRCHLISASFLPLFQRVMTDGSCRSLSQYFSTLNSI